MNTEPLPRVEWDFDTLPKAEFAACGYWEYARESAFIRQTYDRCLKDPESAREDVETIRNLRQIAELWFEDDESVRQRGFPSPWQSLSDDVREELVEMLQWRPDAIAVRTDEFAAKRLYEDAKSAAKLTTAWFAQTKQGKKFPPPPHLNANYRPSIRWFGGCETLIVDIAWEHYNDEELVQAFRKWVGQTRPQHMRKPKRAGHQLRHWRVALRRLGIMRLNYHCTRHRLKSWYPEAWERFRDCYKEWYEAPREVQKFYHKLFPFSHTIFDDPIHLRPKRKGKRWVIYSGPDGKVKFSP